MHLYDRNERRRECWVDWQRFQNNESDVFQRRSVQDTIAERVQGLEKGAVFRRQNQGLSRVVILVIGMGRELGT